MSLARRAARAALAASFISGGLDQLRNPQPKAGPASPIAKPIADRVPQLPNDPESLVKLDGAIKVVGGVGLMVGPFARPAALLLAGSLVPTTLAGHRFWETTDPDQKVSDRVEFFKNVSLLGGLLIAALDTGGRPSVPYVAGKALHGAADSVGDAAGAVGDVVGGAVTGTAGAVAGAAGAVGGAVAHGAGKARGIASRPSPSLSRRARKALAKAEKKGSRALDTAQVRTAAALEVAQARTAAALDAAQESGGRALKRADKATARSRKKARKEAVRRAAKAQALAAVYAASARDRARDTGPVLADAARTAAAATKEGALTAKSGVLAAKDKVGAAVSR